MSYKYFFGPFLAGIVIAAFFWNRSNTRDNTGWVFFDFDLAYAIIAIAAGLAIGAFWQLRVAQTKHNFKISKITYLIIAALLILFFITYGRYLT